MFKPSAPRHVLHPSFPVPSVFKIVSTMHTAWWLHQMCALGKSLLRGINSTGLQNAQWAHIHWIGQATRSGASCCLHGHGSLDIVTSGRSTLLDQERITKRISPGECLHQWLLLYPQTCRCHPWYLLEQMWVNCGRPGNSGPNAPGGRKCWVYCGCGDTWTATKCCDDSILPKVLGVCF